MASVNAPRGLQLAKKYGSGSNSTGIDTIDVNVSPKVASALIPSDIFTGDIIHIESAGTIKPVGAGVNVRCVGVFQGCSFVDANGDQQFKRSYTGGVTATDVKIHVAKDPSQTFFVQADATVTASAGVGTVPMNCNIVVGTGSHKTGQSATMLDADSQVLTQSQLRVIRRAPWDTGIGTSAGVTDAYPWYEVYLNNSNDRFQSVSVCSA
jgi:hypothetical protein|tara:strand:- start:82 stop:708 length:627 start_codon:yes stop_codon:yes gene_type:complete